METDIQYRQQKMQCNQVSMTLISCKTETSQVLLLFLFYDTYLLNFLCSNCISVNLLHNLLQEFLSDNIHFFKHFVIKLSQISRFLCRQIYLIFKQNSEEKLTSKSPWCNRILYFRVRDNNGYISIM